MSARRLQDRTAIVTGASRGIGRAIAELFASEGARVVLVARSAADLESVAADITASGGQAAIVAADIVDEATPDAAVRTALDMSGRVDVLVNNAGGNSFMAPLESMRFSGWQKTMALNLDSTVRMTQAALPALIACGNGSIVNVSSVTGLRGSPLMSHYGAAKAAVISLTQSLAIEVARQGVRVNALVPGWIATDLTGFLRHDEQTEESLLAQVPMHRWGSDAEIARAALFLASDESSFMTGQPLVVDGGLSAQP